MRPSSTEYPGDARTAVALKERRLDDAGEGHTIDNGTKRRRLAGWVLALASFVALAIAVYWPVSPLSNTHLLGCACGDQEQEVWFLAWTAHALAHGVNPFFSGAINAPYGVNLADNTTMPLLGALASPITLLSGPVAAFNLLMRLAFVANAAAMLFVLGRFTKRLFAAYVGALLFAFGPYVIGQAFGHLFLAFVPLPPVILLCCYELSRAGTATSSRRYGLLLGLAAAAQFFISIEVLVTTGVCAVVGLVLAALLRPRAALGAVARFALGAVVALAVFVPLVAYPVWYFFSGPLHVSGPPQSAAALAPYRTDLFGPIVPTVLERLAPRALAATGSAFAAGNVGENGIYLGIPLVVALLAGIAWCRRELLVIVAALVGAAAFVLSLGTPLTVDGHATTTALPFALFTRVPVLDGLLAARFSLYVDLAAALVLAVALDRALERVRHVAAKAVVGLVGAGLLVPLIPAVPIASPALAIPAYFTSSAARSIPANSILLTYPYDYSPYNDGMLWQAITGFRFRIIGGEVTRRGPEGAGTSAVNPLSPTELQNLFRVGLRGSATPVPAPPVTGLGLVRLREFFVRWDVETVVVDPVGAEPQLVVHDLTVVLGRPPDHVGGVDVWYSTASG